MYLDYFNAVVDYYKSGRSSASLPQRLMNPTPGKIKEECLSACEVRFDKKDLRTLNAFFKVENEQYAMLRSIRRCERDRFRPLVNFLNGDTNRTDHLNIELLAWLMDYPNRPFRPETSQNGIAANVNHAEDMEVREGMPEQIKMGEGLTIDNVTLIEQKKDLEPAIFLKTKTRVIQSISKVITRRKFAFLVVGVLALGVLGFMLAGSGSSNRVPGNPPPTTQAADNSSDPVSPSFISAVTYVRCTGASPCKACSNCSSCNWCNSGGTCGICAKTSKRAPTQKRTENCAAITKKGTQCKRAAKPGSAYCWQHSK